LIFSSPLASSADYAAIIYFLRFRLLFSFAYFRFDIGYDDYFAAILLTLIAAS
jgi:hypothetical protein